MTLFDKLSQTIKLVSRGLRTVSQITDSYLILSRKKLSSHAKELFGPSMGSFLRFLIPGFMCRFIFCASILWKSDVLRTQAALPADKTALRGQKRRYRLSSVNLGHCIFSHKWSLFSSKGINKRSSVLTCTNWVDYIARWKKVQIGTYNVRIHGQWTFTNPRKRLL